MEALWYWVVSTWNAHFGDARFDSPFWPPARLDFFIVPSLGGGIMNHGYKKCKNHGSQVCFKNLGIMNLCTSARESWITRLWEKLNKMHVWINCVRARECGIWRFRESRNFQKFSGEQAPGPPPPLYNSSIQGWQSACFSSNSSVLCSVSPHLDKTNDYTECGWKQNNWQKFEHQRNYTKWD